MAGHEARTGLPLQKDAVPRSVSFESIPSSVRAGLKASLEAGYNFINNCDVRAIFGESPRYTVSEMADGSKVYYASEQYNISTFAGVQKSKRIIAWSSHTEHSIPNCAGSTSWNGFRIEGV